MATIGIKASRRRSLLNSSSVTPTATPTQAPRVSVRLSATSSAGITNAAHRRPDDP